MLWKILALVLVDDFAGAWSRPLPNRCLFAAWQWSCCSPTLKLCPPWKARGYLRLALVIFLPNGSVESPSCISG